mgnify:CR=1 FL=1
MGLPVSIHVLVERIDSHLDALIDGVADACAQRLHDVDRVFSAYRHDSDVSRIRRGELAIADADPRVAEVAEACERARVLTAGRFSAYWDGMFDPTGYVKGWAVENTARVLLAPLVAQDAVVAAGINAGGDMQLFTAPGRAWTWNVGIEDPVRPDRLVATVELRDGAVATSGSSHRGAHIREPRAGREDAGVLSASVVADSLTTADVWATALVVDAPPGEHPGRSGLVVAADGTVRRWAAGAQISGHAGLPEAPPAPTR